MNADLGIFLEQYGLRHLGDPIRRQGVKTIPELISFVSTDDGLDALSLNRKDERALIRALDSPSRIHSGDDVVPDLSEYPLMFIDSLVEFNRSGDDPRLRLWALCDLGETMVRLSFAAAFAVSRNETRDQLTPRIVELIERPTFGRWLAMTREVCRSLEDDRVELAWLPSTFKRLDDICSSSLLPLRNRLAHGGGVLRPAADTLLSDHKATYEEIMQCIAPWKSADIVSCFANRGPRLLKGQFPVPWDGIAPEPGQVGLVFEGKIVTLWPMLTEHEYGTGMYARCDEVAMHYTPFQGTEPSMTSLPDEYETFMELFRVNRKAQPNQLLVRSFDAEIRKEACRLVGREKELASLLKAVRSLKDGGILWVEGSAGIGKSCLMAELSVRFIEETQSPWLFIPYRFKSGDDRCDQAPFARYIVERLISWDGLAPEAVSSIPESISETEKLDRLIGRINDSAGVVFLVDGIDEMPSRHDAWLKQLIASTSATQKTKWIISGRPDRDIHDQLLALGAVMPFEDGLPPMSDADVRSFFFHRLNGSRTCRDLLARDEDGLESVSNPFLREIIKRSEGLPVYMNYAVGDIFTGKLRVDREQELPSGLANYHEELIRRCALGDLQAVMTPIVAMLALAYEPLSPNTIASLLKLRGLLATENVDMVNRALAGLGAMVRRSENMEGGIAYTLYHDSLRQHIRETSSMSETVRAARSTLADLIKEYAEYIKTPCANYLLRSGIRHLLDGGDYNAALHLMQNFEYAMIRMGLYRQISGSVARWFEDWNALGPKAGHSDQSFYNRIRHQLLMASQEWPAYKVLLQLAAEGIGGDSIVSAADEWNQNNPHPWLWLRRATSNGKDQHEALIFTRQVESDNAVRLDDERFLLFSHRAIHVCSSFSGDTLQRIVPPEGEFLGMIISSSKEIISWGNGKRIWIWSPNTGDCIHVLEGGGGEFNSVVELPGGRLLSWRSSCTNIDVVIKAYCSVHQRLEGKTLQDEQIPEKIWSSEALVWRISDGRELCSLDCESQSINGVIPFLDSYAVLWGEKHIGVYDCKDGSCVRMIKEHHNGILLVDQIEGDDFLSIGESICRWNALMGAKRYSVRVKHAINVFRYSDYVITSTGFDGLYITSVKEGKEIANIHIPLVDKLVGLTMDKIAVTAEFRNELWIIDLSQMKIEHQLNGHKAKVEGMLAMSSEVLISFEGGGAIRFWSVVGGHELHTIQTNTSSIVQLIKLSENRMLSRDRDNIVAVWDVSSALVNKQGNERQLVHASHYIPGGLNPGRTFPISITPIGEEGFISWRESSPVVNMWHNSRSRSFEMTDTDGETLFVNSVVKLGNENCLIALGDSYAVFGPQTKTLVPRELAACRTLGFEAKILSVSVWISSNLRRITALFKDNFTKSSPNRTDLQPKLPKSDRLLDDGLLGIEDTLWIGNSDVLVWDTVLTMAWINVESGEIYQRYTEPECGIMGAILLEGDRFATWSAEEHLICIWEKHTGRCLHRIMGHSDSTICGLRRFDKNRLLSWSSDGTIRMWSIDKRCELQIIKAYDDGDVEGIDILDSDRLLSWRNGMIGLWSLASAECIYLGDADGFMQKHPEEFLVFSGNVGARNGSLVGHDNYLFSFKTGPIPWVTNGDWKIRLLTRNGVAVFVSEQDVALAQLYFGAKPISVEDFEKIQVPDNSNTALNSSI